MIDIPPEELDADLKEYLPDPLVWTNYTSRRLAGLGE